MHCNVWTNFENSLVQGVNFILSLVVKVLDFLHLVVDFLLKFDLPFTLNETNTFGESSFFINLDSRFTDDSVRLVIEYEKKLFLFAAN